MHTAVVGAAVGAAVGLWWSSSSSPWTGFIGGRGGMGGRSGLGSGTGTGRGLLMICTASKSTVTLWNGVENLRPHALRYYQHGDLHGRTPSIP